MKSQLHHSRRKCADWPMAGADVAWIETMSSSEEVNAAAEAATAVGLPYVITCFV